MKPSTTFECQNISKFDFRRQDQSSSTDSFDNLSITKAPVTSMNWANFTTYHFQKSKKSNSEWKQFPMFNMNRKIETILGQMRRTGYGTDEARMNGQKLVPGESSISPHLIEFASEEHQLQQQRLPEATNKEILMEENNDLSGMKNDDERALGRFQSSGTGSGNSCHDRLIKSNKSCCNVEIVRTRSTSNSLNTRSEVPQKNANATPLLFTEQKDMNLYHEDQMEGESSVPANFKGNSFYDALTLPALLGYHSPRGENLAPLVDSTNMKHSEAIDVNFMRTQNEHSGKPDIMGTDVLPASSSPIVGTSSKSLKFPQDAAYDILKYTGITATNSKLMSSRDTSTSRPESMDTTQKWVKRLRPNTLDVIPLASKRLKLGDSSSGSEMQSLVNWVATHARSISSQPQIKQLEKAQSCSGDSVKAIPWIQRWCRPSQDMSSVKAICEPEHTNVILEKLEAKHFPSLAAMAMVGKSVNNFHPCEFRRRGSTTVWSTGSSDAAAQIVLMK